MKIQNRNWSCPRNANKDLVKALTDMGMKVGELKAQKECMEKDRKKELEDQKEKYDRKIFVTDYSSNKNISEGE